MLLLVDSTGLRLCSAAEWLVGKHGHPRTAVIADVGEGLGTEGFAKELLRRAAEYDVRARIAQVFRGSPSAPLSRRASP